MSEAQKVPCFLYRMFFRNQNPPEKLGLEWWQKQNKKILELAAENAALKQKLTLVGFHKIDKETHIQESAQFVKEATEKIEALSERLKEADKVLQNLVSFLDDTVHWVAPINRALLDERKEAAKNYLSKTPKKES